MKTVDRAGAISFLQQARNLRPLDAASAEQAYRSALGCDPGAAPALIELAALLREQGRFEEALGVTRPTLALKPANHGVLAAHAETLKAAGDPEGSLAVYARARDENPASAVALHNLAASLGDLDRCAESEAQARRALAAGLDAPQTWLVLARALLGQGRLDESEAAYRDVLKRSPADPDAHRELAQLIWMRTGDAGQALTSLDQTLATGGDSVRLLEVKAIAAKFTGDLDMARATIGRAVASYPGDAAALVTASHLANISGDPGQGLVHARRAVATAPTSRWTRLGLCEALLANGEAAEAASVAGALYAEEPYAQDVIAYLATAWRLLSDARYGALFDYASLVNISALDIPKGWSSLAAFLADLKGELEALHVFQTHPFQQSLLHGSQVMGLNHSANPVVKALFEALAGPIGRIVAKLGAGTDPVRARNTGDTRYQGVWSVRLSGGGGRHLNHMHPKGWLSSACYIDLPEAVTGSTNREGWLNFGEPGVATAPALPAEWWVQPEAGALVLFPSYMWHGVTPYSGQGRRLSVAFDLLPATTSA